MRFLRILLPAVILTGSGSLSAEPITIAEARESIGKTVELKGLVVTKSISGKNAYWSFGDAYPRQTFTVQYDYEKVANADLKLNPAGREVIVTGKVEGNAKGPRLVLTDLNQAKLVPLDENDVFSKPVDGGDDGQNYSAAWQQILMREEFDRIEKRAAEFEADEERSVDGMWLSTYFFEGLELPDGPTEAGWVAAKERLLRWKKVLPESKTAQHAYAAFLVKYAWYARGGGWAHTVTEEGGRNFSLRLDEAKQALDEIPDAARRPYFYSIMLTVALGQSWEKKKMFEVFHEAKTRYPEYPQYYFKVAMFLLPRWYGANGEWEKWLDEETKYDSPYDREIYARVVWAQSEFYRQDGRANSDIFKQTAVTWPRTKAGFEEIVSRTPDSWRNLSAYAWFSALGDDSANFLRLADQMKGHENMNIWRSWSNYQMMREWATTAQSKP